MATTCESSRDAHVVHAALGEKLALSARAEGEAFVLFADMLHRELFRDLGCSSIYRYAEERLDFSSSKTAQFVRLAKSIETLPVLFEALRRGRLSWTEARVVAGVCTPETERRWVEEAMACSRRELSRKIDLARAVARQRAAASARQAPLPVSPSSAGKEGPVPETPARAARARDTHGPEPSEPIDVPMPVTLRFNTEQFARFQALIEAHRKSGAREPREDLVLAALDRGLGGLSANGVRYRVVTYACETCGRAHIPTSRGDRQVPLAELEAQLGAAEIVRPGRRKRRPISKRVRERVLERDGHRCRSAGCSNTQFLDVHHRVPVAAGGDNRFENLITLCHGCHRACHEHKAKRLPRQRRVHMVRARLGIVDDRRLARSRSP